MKINKIWILSLILFLGIQAQAQEWTRKLDGPLVSVIGSTSSSFQGHDVQQTMDGNYTMIGVQSFPTGAPRDYPGMIKVNAQGFTLWEKSYFSDNGDPAFFTDLSLVEMPNGNLLFAGINSNNIVQVQTNSVGDTIWTKSMNLNTTFPLLHTIHELNLRATNDGNYILGVNVNVSTGGAPIGSDYTHLIKFNSSGTILWQKTHTDFDAEDLRPTLDGGYILSGYEAPSLATAIPAIRKLDMNGDSTWQQTFTGMPASSLHTVTETPDSTYVVGGELNGFVGPTPFLAKIDKNGTVQWTTMNMILGAFAGRMNHVEYDVNGYLVATGYVNQPHPVLGVQVDVAFVVKYDLLGNLLVEEFFDGWNTNKGEVIRPTTDGGYIMVGTNSSSMGSFDLGYLVKVDSLFNKPIHNFSGHIYRDNDNDCIQDAGEVGLNNWLIEIKKNNNDIYYATTDSTGYYSIQVDTGTFTIKAIAPNNLWDFCLDSVIVTSAALHNADTVDFGAIGLANCPLLNVDISTPFLRRCFSNVYTISYCNHGTVNAQNSYVEVELDTSIYMTNASIPWTSGAGSLPTTLLYRFNIGTIPFGTCGSFTVNTAVSCHSILGQTHCVEAHIYPDTSCVPAHPQWDRSNIDVEGLCFGDSIRFKVKNIGTGNMSVFRQYNVTEDHVMLMTNPFKLDAGDSLMVVIQTNGANYRLQADQDPFHPHNTYRAMAVQMCYNNSITTFSGQVGSLAQYADDDGSPAVSRDCQENIGSWDPNDKRGFPLGYGVAHAIEQNTDLEYHIRFQNTGTDTAFNVIVFDTLASFLDPSSVIVGASSHLYNWELKDQGVLVFYFNNIMLADSNVNEPASHGFVKFRIKQQPNNPLGTIINNTAGIVFDMNAPVITNTTFHTVDRDFIVSNIQKIGNRPTTIISAYPNPFEQEAIVEIEGEVFDELEIKVIDAMGRMVQYQKVANQSQITIQRQGLGTGVYFFQLIGDGELIGTGKIVAQ